jgi:hypothetical protein
VEFAVVVVVDDDCDDGDDDDDDADFDGRKLGRGRVLIGVVIPCLWRMGRC